MCIFIHICIKFWLKHSGSNQARPVRRLSAHVLLAFRFFVPSCLQLRVIMAANDAIIPSSAKRGRPDAEPESNFDVLVAGLRTEVLGYVDKNLKSTAGHLTTSFVDLVKSHDKKREKRLSKLELDMQELHTNHDSLQADVAAFKEQVGKVQQQLHIQE